MAKDNSSKIGEIALLNSDISGLRAYTRIIEEFSNYSVIGCNSYESAVKVLFGEDHKTINPNLKAFMIKEHKDDPWTIRNLLIPYTRKVYPNMPIRFTPSVMRQEGLEDLEEVLDIDIGKVSANPKEVITYLGRVISKKV